MAGQNQAKQLHIKDCPLKHTCVMAGSQAGTLCKISFEETSIAKELVLVMLQL